MNKCNYLVETLHFIPNSVQCLLKIAFKMIFKYASIKLEQIPGNFLKADTISNEQFFSRMDLTQFLYGVILILRISIFESLGLKFLYIDDVIITKLSCKRNFLISQLFSN